MKIFISYGHDDYENLVNAVYEELCKNGYEVWKDNRYEGESGIPAGDDFTDIIYSQIDKSDYVIAFVTAKTIARKFCRDERIRAFNKPGYKLIQIRLDNVDIKLGNSCNYIDMGNVVDKRGNVNYELFRKKMEAIFAAIRNPDSLISPMMKIEKYLKVGGAEQYEEFVSMPNKYDFVGREWLKEKCINWVMDENAPHRLFVILGDAGTGKTAFVKNLARDDKLVRSVHICIYDKPSTRKIKDVLKDLSYVLSLTNKSYREYLHNCDLEKIMQYNYDGLFEELFINPLKNEQEKYLLIIDGLDELEKNDGFEPLINIFRQFSNKMNPRISILVTGRPDENIINGLKTVTGESEYGKVFLDKQNGKNDILEFAEKHLKNIGHYSEELLQKILEACDGNFEYLTLLFEEAETGGFEIDGNIVLPKGLINKYAQYLNRKLKNSEQKFSKTQMHMLSVLCAAYEPLPLSLISEITGIDEYDADEEIELLGSLIHKEKLHNGDCIISFFSKGFCDFLMSGEYRNYRIKAVLGNNLISEYVLKNCKNEQMLLKNQYLDKYAFSHILKSTASDFDAVITYIRQFINTNEDKTVQRIKNALAFSTDTVDNFYVIGKELSMLRSIENALKADRELAALNRLCEVYKNQGDEFRYLLLYGDILKLSATPAALSDAEKLYYKKCLEICLQKYQNSPVYENRKNLSDVYDRLGDILRFTNIEKKLIEAKHYYKLKLQLDIQNYREKPSYESKYALGIAYDRLGYISRKRENDTELELPEYYYEKKLEIIKEAYDEKPCYECRYEISRTYNKLGDILKSNSTQESYIQAKKLYLEQLPYAERNYSENPCYESRIELAVLYKNLGYIVKRIKQKTIDEEKNSLIQCEEMYRKSFDLIKLNYEENPCFRSRRELALIYERLGYVEQEKDTDSFSKAAEYYSKMFKLIEHNYTDCPSSLSKNDYSYACKIMYNFYSNIGSQEVKEEINYWKEKMIFADSIGL